MMRSPLFSKRSLIAPVRFRLVASGLMIDKVRSMVIRISRSGDAGYTGDENDRQRALKHAALTLLLPARPRLLPICQAVSGFAGTAPAAARRLYGITVVAVEDIGAARERLEIPRFEAVDEDDHRGPVRVFVEMGQPDRLYRRIAVASRAMRQKGGVLIRPQRRIQMFDPFWRPGPDHRPMAVRARTFEKLGQGSLERHRL